MNPLKAFVGTFKTSDDDVINKPLESIYNIDINTLQGKPLDLSNFKGKSILFVNVASKCGFTPQYKKLQQLQDQYQDSLVVIGVPCNQFGGQEPGSDSEIASFCGLKFKTTFPLFSKIDVNGDDTSDLYKYLKEEAPGLLGSKKIKWNFTKFLVDKEGKVLKRYAPQVKPKDMNSDIEKCL